MKIITEPEFAAALRLRLLGEGWSSRYVGSVTGPGRSGAVAAVYVSHLLGIPFIPYGAKVPTQLGPLLIVDTATESGKTLRKAARKYQEVSHMTLAVYDESDPKIGRVSFWYEGPKPQRYRHECAA